MQHFIHTPHLWKQAGHVSKLSAWILQYGISHSPPFSEVWTKHRWVGGLEPLTAPSWYCLDNHTTRKLWVGALCLENSYLKPSACYIGVTCTKPFNSCNPFHVSSISIQLHRTYCIYTTRTSVLVTTKMGHYILKIIKHFCPFCMCICSHDPARWTGHSTKKENCFVLA